MAVSGGADSLALAALAQDWITARGGEILGLVVDHGLRAESAAEARHAAAQLARLGIESCLLRAAGLARGSGLSHRARHARYGLLMSACAERGILHLLLGHHRADQAETVAIRRSAGSGEAGLAAMPALVETRDVRLLRPLLDIAPGRLRATLRARRMRWIEDPSNSDPKSQRARIRAQAADPDGGGSGIAALVGEANRLGVARRAGECRAAAWLARHAEIRPEGYAMLGPGPWDPHAIAALLRMLAGAEYGPSLARVSALTARPRACTLAGIRVSAAGRWRPGGWLLSREEAAMAPPAEARAGSAWDGRFRLQDPRDAASAIGAAENDARRWRGMLPTVVLRTLPVLQDSSGETILRPLHLSTPDMIVFAPPCPAACAPFAPLQPGC